MAVLTNTTMQFRLAQDYPAVMREQLGDRLPLFTEQEFKLLMDAEVDFYGMNYYTCQFARHRSLPAPDTDYVGNVDELQENKAGDSIGEQAGIWWLYSVPKGFRKHLVRIYEKYGKTIYITENGCPCPGEDKMTKEESVDDGFRQRYFSEHLDAIVGATQDGARIAGYFAWSLMDNLGKFCSAWRRFFSLFPQRHFADLMYQNGDWALALDSERHSQTTTRWKGHRRSPP